MRIFLALLLTVISLTATAGIRVILGGGGYSEMVALSAWSHAGQFVKACLRQPDLCFLSPAQTELIRSALNHPLNRQLAFANDIDHLNIDDVRVILPSRWLYVDEQTPKPLAEIHRLVLRAWLSQPELQLGEKGAVLADHLSGELIYNQSNFDLDKGRLEIASIRSSRAISFIVSYITADKALDLSDDIRAQLNCGPRVAQLTSFSETYIEDGHLLGQMQWLCGSEAYQSRFVLEPVSRRLVLINVTDLGKRDEPGRCDRVLAGTRR